MGASIVIEDERGNRVRVNPARDIAHFWGQLVALAMDRLHDEKLWPAGLRKQLKEAGVTPEDMARAGTRLEKALRMALRRGPERPEDALRATGFLEVNPLIQQAIMARIGQVCLGAWWEGIKDATTEGVVPACHADLLQTGMALAAALNEEFDPALPPPLPERV